MTRDDLSNTAKRRLTANQSCPICNKIIHDDEELLFTVRRRRRCKQYIFYHERCLINGEEKNKTKGKRH